MQDEHEPHAVLADQRCKRQYRVEPAAIAELVEHHQDLVFAIAQRAKPYEIVGHLLYEDRNQPFIHLDDVPVGLQVDDHPALADLGDRDRRHRRHRLDELVLQEVELGADLGRDPLPELFMTADEFCQLHARLVGQMIAVSRQELCYRRAFIRHGIEDTIKLAQRLARVRALDHKAQHGDQQDPGAFLPEIVRVRTQPFRHQHLRQLLQIGNALMRILADHVQRIETVRSMLARRQEIDLVALLLHVAGGFLVELPAHIENEHRSGVVHHRRHDKAA